MRLLDKRYEEIKIEVAKLYKNYNIKKYPIDVFELCKNMKLRTITYGEMSLEAKK